MRFIFMLFVFVFATYAKDTIYLDANLSSVISAGEILYDKDNVLTINDIVKNKNFKSNTEIDIPYYEGSIWLKNEIVNIDNKNLSFVLQNIRSGIDSIDVYVFYNDKLINTVMLGDMRNQEDRDLLYRNSAFVQNFNANSSYIIYTKIKSTGQLYAAWKIENLRDFVHISTLELLAWGLLGGILIAFMIYGITAYMSLKDKTILIYILSAFTMLLLQYSINGIFYQLNLGIDLKTLTIVGTWVLPYLIVSLSLLFAIFFFELKNESKYIYYFFAILTLTSLGFSIFFLLAYLDEHILRYSAHTAPVAFISIFAAFIIGFWGLYKNKAGAIYYILGQGSYLICLTYSGAVIMAYLPLYEYSSFITPIGILINITFLSIALSKKIKDIKLENIKNLEILTQKARFFSIGQTVGNIAHQWKNPINHISSQLVLLEATLNFKKDKIEQAVEDILPQMQQSVEYIKNSVDDFYDFYSNSGNKTKFSPKDEIGVILRIFKEKITLSGINIEINDSFKADFTGYKSSFLTVIMVVVENAIWQLINQNVKNPKININISKQGKFLKITVSDNGGGIKTVPIDAIFDSLKKSSKSDGCGIGLNIAKQIMNEKFFGDIIAENIDNGASFTLNFTLN